MPGIVVLETQQLVLRELTADDGPLFIAVDQDPRVMLYVDIGNPYTQQRYEQELWPRTLKLYQEQPGLGYFLAFEKLSGDCIGWFHFRPSFEDAAETELGYRLHHRFWGRGYATEMSRALVHRGFTEMGTTRVVAYALQANRGSTRVMEKAGLMFEKRYEEPRALYPDKRAVKYGLSSEEYAARKGLA
jgi:RimJ/RimL family protein N-acetyltransferase